MMLTYCVVVAALWLAILGAFCMSFGEGGYATPMQYKIEKKIKR